MREESLMMRGKDLKRLKIMEAVGEKGLKQRKAGELLELSERQIRRLLRRVEAEGAGGLIHKSRGKESNRRYAEGFRQRVVEVYRKRYEGFGPTLAREKMQEREKIQVGRETLRQWLIEKKLWESRSYGPQHRQWRERKECFGEMLQMDGSHHDWLEGRGSKMVLMGYIDDATGHVYGRFYDYEGTMPAMDSFYRYAKRYGLPQSLYLDKHSTYKGWAQKLTLEEQLAGREESVSEFGRAMGMLGVKVIHAHSPQAKGRIERLFGTLQDRLIKEMRLEKIRTQEEANDFLEKYLAGYNRKFDKKAKSGADLHQRAPKNLKQILSIQTQHVLRNDNTVQHQGKFYQILSRWTNRKPLKVTTQERLDGKLYMMDQGRELEYEPIKNPPPRFTLKASKPQNPKGIPVPMSHPYKRKSFERYLNSLKTKTAA